MPRYLKKWSGGWWLIGLLVLLFVGAGSSPASAEEPSDITWSVRPASSAGPDGRSWIETSLEPRSTIIEHLAVTNFSDQPVTFTLTSADGYFTEEGRFNMLPTAQPSVDAGTWISIEPTVTLPAHGMATVPFTITVPPNAEPGDHAAGVAASVLGSSVDDTGSRVTVDSRVGFRVMTLVEGDLKPAASIDLLNATYEPTWNPFGSGSADVTFNVKNSGNTRLIIDGTVRAGDVESEIHASNTPDEELLPGENGNFTVKLTGVYPTFQIPITVELRPDAPTLPDGTRLDPVVEKTTVWAPPLPLLGMTVMAIALGLIITKIAIIRRRRIAALVDRAREEGRREAHHESSS
ncbi:hypothetical protein TZ00_09880 [Agreia bicolorata]|uniref:DUF916 domain-containing protein n=2 Tax=Agreia bicolorata TaxID=110935 RepID=A0ABR5CG48_9MICO|nr:hypothetical protein TZ00_09880 [Agreia bicolorata]